MFHHRCNDRIANLEAQLSAAREKATNHEKEIDSLRGELAREESNLWDAFRRNQDLAKRNKKLTDLDEALERSREADAHRKVLEARRRRAAEEALGGAWGGPGHEKSGKAAAVSQAMLALPLASYDVVVGCERGFDGEWSWTVDGAPIDPYHYTDFVGVSEEDVLVKRFGFARGELAEIFRAAERALVDRTV